MLFAASKDKIQTMKKIILSTALLVTSLFASQINAQNAQSEKQNKGQYKNLSPDERIKKETETASIKLGLNAEQKVKWEQATRERITANAPMKEKLEGSTTPEERKLLKTQMKANAKKFDENVLSFLNPDQKAKYETFKKEQKNKKQKHGEKEMN